MFKRMGHLCVNSVISNFACNSNTALLSNLIIGLTIASEDNYWPRSHVSVYQESEEVEWIQLCFKYYICLDGQESSYKIIISSKDNLRLQHSLWHVMITPCVMREQNNMPPLHFPHCLSWCSCMMKASHNPTGMTVDKTWIRAGRKLQYKQPDECQRHGPMSAVWSVFAQDWSM